MGTSMPDSFRTNPDIGRLFPNFVELERNIISAACIHEFMHLVAIKKSVYEKYPFVATSLFNAFNTAKEDRAGTDVQSAGVALHDTMAAARYRRNS